MMKLVVFASGSGSNAENIIQHFAGSDVRVQAIFCNVEGAGVVERANRLGVSCELFNRTEWKTGDRVDALLEKYSPDLIVLAGFLWLFPKRLIDKYPHVINLHPALLPKFGGKGMFGIHVHEAVVAAAETKTGITVHWVTELYDDGAPIFQARCEVSPTDTANDVAQKIHALEQAHFPRVVEEVLKDIQLKA
ncbi:MAG: phosphoribosylglycinamide formyltransferase [Bacteroidota bacterium]